MTDQQKKALQSLGSSPYGKALSDFLGEEFERMKDVRNCENWEQVLGKKYALQLLKDLFSLMGVQETPTKKGNPYI